MVVGSTRREGGAGDAHRLTSALLLTDLPLRRRICLSPARFRSRGDDALVANQISISSGQTPISLCQAMCRSLVRPSDLDARSRAPHRSWGALALASNRPPTHPPFFFEAVAPRKLVSQRREVISLF